VSGTHGVGRNRSFLGFYLGDEANNLRRIPSNIYCASLEIADIFEHRRSVGAWRCGSVPHETIPGLVIGLEVLATARALLFFCGYTSILALNRPRNSQILPRWGPPLPLIVNSAIPIEIFSTDSLKSRVATSQFRGEAIM
jgi:hypothetical protein